MVVSQAEPENDSPRPIVGIYYRPGSTNSRLAQRYVEDRLASANDAYYQSQLAVAGITAQPPGSFRRVEVDAGGGGGMSLATIAPLVLILMTMTGAVYPAIDLTAGERERGTLETLIAAPVPRLGLLLAKYIAVLTVALLTATVNMIAMTATIMVSGLGPQIFGAGVFSFTTLVQVFCLLALFAAFFSAVLLTVTSMARSFKEAQAYLVPLMLISLAPGIMGAMPGLEMSAAMAITPLVNIVLLARDLLNGQVNAPLGVVAVAATAFYTAAAIALAARIFGGDAVLYGSQGGWRDLLRRPETEDSVAEISTSTFCLALIFPLYFLISGLLQQLLQAAFDDQSPRGAMISLLLAAIATALLFGVIPLAAAAFTRVRLSSGFGLRPPSILSLFAAVAFGVSLWTFAHEIVLFASFIGIGAITAEQFAGIERLLEAWRDIPLWLILLSLAVAPAVFEEFFFRGLLFGSLTKRLSPAKAILVSAALFGAFHVVSGSALAVERLLPSTFIGLFLGWLRYRSGSIFPSMLAHLLNNGLLLCLAYYREEVQELDLAWRAKATFR